MSDWFPGFDEYIYLSAVRTPTQSYKISLFNSRAPLHLTTGSLLLPITRFDELHYHLDRDIIDRSIVDDLQARRDTEQQRTQAIELQALTNEAADHFRKALFGTSAFAKTNNKLRVSIPMNFAPCRQGFKCALLCKKAKTDLASSECYCVLESLAKPDQAALDVMHSFLKRLLDLQSRTLHARYTQERLSGESSAKELTYTALGYGNSNSDNNDIHAITPYFARSPASSYSRSSYQRTVTHYSGSYDPTLSEAAEWHELMDS